MRKTGNARLYIAFVAILFVATLVLLEGGLRLYQWARHDSRYIVNDDILHHKLRANVDVIDRTRENPFRLVTNAQGWPEAEDVPLAKPAGTLRLFEIGDSNTQGVVDHGQRMSDLVEASLAAGRASGEPGIDVVNAGTSSYSILLYQLLIEREIMPRDPDIVVINVDMTDVANDLLYRRFAVRGADGRITAFVDTSETGRFNYVMTPTGLIEIEKANPLYVAFVEYSALGYYVDKVIARLRFTGSLSALGYPVDESANWLAPQWTPDIEANVATSMQALAETIRELRTRGTGVVLSGVPHLPQFEGKWSVRPFDALASVACAEGIPFIDLYTEIRKRVPAEGIADLYFASDPTHFDAEGNRIWADIQIETLTDPAYGLLTGDAAKLPPDLNPACAR